MYLSNTDKMIDRQTEIRMDICSYKDYVYSKLSGVGWWCHPAACGKSEARSILMQISARRMRAQKDCDGDEKTFPNCSLKLFFEKSVRILT